MIDLKTKRGRRRKMLYLYCGKRRTLRQIGLVYGLSGERIRQILAENPLYQVMQENARRLVETKCFECGVIVKSPRSHIKKFCSRVCFQKSSIGMRSSTLKKLEARTILCHIHGKQPKKHFYQQPSMLKSGVFSYKWRCIEEQNRQQAESNRRRDADPVRRKRFQEQQKQYQREYYQRAHR